MEPLPPTGDFFGGLLAFVKAGGPLSLAILAAWWGYRKDLALTKAHEEQAARDRETFAQITALVGASTTAAVKLEAAVVALKDAINMRGAP